MCILIMLRNLCVWLEGLFESRDTGEINEISLDSMVRD